MASVIIMAADKVLVHENSWIMIHEAEAVAVGRADDLDTDAKMHLDSIIAVKVKDEQGMPARPRRYGFTRRANRSRRLI